MKTLNYRLLLFLLLSFFEVSAQSISVKSFQLLPTDMTASSIEGKRVDQNGQVAALIKIVTIEKGFSFEGGTLGIVDSQQRKGEIWVWVPRGLRKITILHEQFGVLRDYRFPEEIEAERTYEMVIATATKVEVSEKEKNIVPEEGIPSLLVFDISPSNAVLEVNDQLWHVDAQGIAKQYVDPNEYTYRVNAPGYCTEAGKVTVDGLNNPQKVTIALQPDLEGVVSPECVFSVSPSKKVYFSKGNLQYQASTSTWRFAEHQWDCIGKENKNISTNYSGWIDLFCWGTGDKPTRTDGMFDHSVYTTFVDWGINKILNKVGQWRTLTSNEWYYVFNARPSKSGIRYTKASVSNVKGVILLPDDWDKNYYPFNEVNNNKASFESNKISESDWTNLIEIHGAVFLPAAGGRSAKTVGGVNKFGYYWSSTPIRKEFAYYLYIKENNLDPQHMQIGRGNGASVRLVRDL